MDKSFKVNKHSGEDELLPVSRSTGEVFGRIVAKYGDRTAVGAHVLNLQKARMALAKDREITGVIYRVLMYLEAVADYDNRLHVMQRDVVRDLGLPNSNVSRAFKVLVAKGIVEKLSESQMNPGYRFNPNYGWRGGYGSWKSAKAKASPLRLQSAA